MPFQANISGLKRAVEKQMKENELMDEAKNLGERQADERVDSRDSGGGTTEQINNRDKCEWCGLLRFEHPDHKLCDELRIRVAELEGKLTEDQLYTYVEHLTLKRWSESWTFLDVWQILRATDAQRHKALVLTLKGDDVHRGN